MMNKSIYIKAVLVVFGLLLLSRIPALVAGDLSALILVSTIVEFIFFVWGVTLIAKK
jgi:hypothetical protein